MKQKIYILCLVAVALMMSSCYTHRVVGLLQDRKGLPKYEKEEYEPYRIMENDEVIYRLITMDETISKVMMAGTESMNNNNSITYRVYPDGTIELPFLEPIYVKGMTLDSARQVVQEKMREIIPDAEIKLSIYNKTFTVIGDINSGVYPIYKEKLNIYQALAMTGELMNSGDHHHVRIIRPTQDSTEPEVLEFDIRTNTIIESKYYYVYPNDVIYVARSKGSFYKVASYSSFLALITSSLSLLVSVINYTTLVP